jgi:hypothetical protein
MKCFNDEKQHIGDLQTLFNFGGIDTDRVLKWCPVCGAVVVDLMVDNRRMGTVVRMQFPEITKNALKKG